MATTYQSSATSSSTKPLYRGVQIVWYLVYIVEILLLFRVFLKMLEANTAAWFTSFIYAVTDPLVAPFIKVFSTTQIDGSIFEWTTILAMFVYWLIAIAIVRLFTMSRTVSTPEAAEKLEKQEV